MTKEQVIHKIEQAGIVAVIRADSKADAIKIVDACVTGGIYSIELTYTVPNASSVIEALNKQYKDKILLGAGTVLDVDTAKAAIKARSKYIVSPGFDEATAKYCQEHGVLYIPGCFTLTEIMYAMKYQIELIKLFPGSAVNPSYVKAIKAPLPNIKVMPTGGVSLDNLEKWFKNGVTAVGVGGELTAPARLNNFLGVTENAHKFVKKIKDI